MSLVARRAVAAGLFDSGTSDTTAPTVAITLSDYTITTGDTPTVTFTFSEAPTGFAEADITTPNGALSAFGVTGNPLVYTATFTPTAGVVDATNVITVGTNWTDAAGNPPASSTNSNNYTIDTTYTISGTVFDADGTTAVEGATVVIGAHSTTSAANGTYTLTGFVTGESGSMTCMLAGYSWTAITVAAMAGNLTAQNYTNAWWAAGGSAATATAVYKPIGAATISASKVNIINPGTHDAVNGATAPTWDATNGWIFGVGAYLTTDLRPAGSWTFIIRFSNAGSTECFILGVFDGGGNEMGIAPVSSTNVRYENPNTVNVAPQITSGVLAIAGANGFRNGTKEVTTLTVSPGTSSKDMWLGALNLNGSRYGSTDNIQACAFYTTTLSDAQVAAISAAMAALNP